MKKQLLIVLIFTFLAEIISAKKVDMFLSITWKEKDMHFFEINEKVQVPFLTITYKNNSGDSVYFFNRYATNENYFSLAPVLSTHNLSIPEKYDSYITEDTDTVELCKNIGRERNFNLRLDNKEMKKKYSAHFTNILYSYIYIDFKPENDTLLEIMSECYSDIRYLLMDLEKDDPVYYDKRPLDPFYDPNLMRIFEAPEFSFDSLNLYFKPRNDSLKNDQYREEIKQRKYNKYVKKIENNYIYLKPYEKKEIEFDLTVLYLLGGNYNIIYPDHILPTQLYYLDDTLPLDKMIKLGKKARIYYNLPKKHNGYKLYDKKIKGKEIKLEIP